MVGEPAIWLSCDPNAVGPKTKDAPVEHELLTTMPRGRGQHVAVLSPKASKAPSAS